MKSAILYEINEICWTKEQIFKINVSHREYNFFLGYISIYPIFGYLSFLLVNNRYLV